jgi:hypothetical protein
MKTITMALTGVHLPFLPRPYHQRNARAAYRSIYSDAGGKGGPPRRSTHIQTKKESLHAVHYCG